jgi:hypothetical protein
MNTGYANSSRTLFEQLFANRISETQTPIFIQFLKKAELGSYIVWQASHKELRTSFCQSFGLTCKNQINLCVIFFIIFLSVCIYPIATRFGLF